MLMLTRACVLPTAFTRAVPDAARLVAAPAASGNTAVATVAWRACQ